VVGPAGIEPATLGLEIRCSILLSYGPTNDNSSRSSELLHFFGRCFDAVTQFYPGMGA
jgi:hypothetical protein